MEQEYKIYFMDNDENGWIRCKPARTSLSLIAYKIPRDRLEERTEENTESEDIAALGNSGIYILLGRDDNNDDAAYIGQVQIRKSGESFLARFSEHEKAKDFWDEAIVFTTSTTDPEHRYQATALNYLEYLFIEMAEKAGSYVIKNRQHPGQSAEDISHQEKVSYNDDFEIAKHLVYALGHGLFVERKEKKKFTNKAVQSMSKSERKKDFVTDRLNKAEIRSICKKVGIDLNGILHCAVLDKRDLKKYWINIRFEEFTDNNITIVLQDWINKILYILEIPAGSIKKEELATKGGDPHCSDIKFLRSDESFRDYRGKRLFRDFYKCAIDYNYEPSVLTEFPKKLTYRAEGPHEKKKKENKKTKPIAFSIGNYKCEKISKYKDLLDEVIRYLVSIDEQKMYDLAKQNFTMAKNKDGVPYITFDQSRVENRDPHIIISGDQPIYYITNLNKNDTKDFAMALVKKYGFKESDFKITEVEKTYPKK